MVFLIVVVALVVVMWLAMRKSEQKQANTMAHGSPALAAAPGSASTNAPVPRSRISEGEPLDLNSDGTMSFTVFPAVQRLIYDGRTEDCLFVTKGTSEYRVTGTRVETRLLELTSKVAGRTPSKLTLVADGVVIESAVRQGATRFAPAEEKLAELRVDTEWHDVTSMNVRFYVLAHHPELLPAQEFRRAVRIELERIRNGFASVLEVSAGIGLQPNEHGEPIQFPDNWSESQRTEATEKLEEALRANNLASHEIGQARALTAQLEGWLERVRG